MTSFKTILIAAALAAAFAGAARAENSTVSADSASTSGPITFVGGKLVQVGQVDNQIAVAIGQNVDAANAIATIYEGSVLRNDATQVGTAKNQIAVAIGQNATAYNAIAAVGAPKSHR